MSRPLSNILELIDRSIFKVLDDKLVEEGYAVDRTVAGILTDEAAWKAAEQAIIADKGYVVEMFGLSNNHEKQNKKIPRITYIPQRLMPGSIGNSPAFRYELDEGTGDFNKLIDPNQTSEYQFKIGIHASNAKQFRLLHAIIAASIPHRQYIPLFTDETQNFLIEQYSYQDNPDYNKGILEGFYMYKAVDLFEHDPSNLGVIPAISDVTVEDAEKGSSRIADINVNTG